MQVGTISLEDSVILVTRKSDISIKDMIHYLDTKTIPQNIFHFIEKSNFVAQSYKDDMKKCRLLPH